MCHRLMAVLLSALALIGPQSVVAAQVWNFEGFIVNGSGNMPCDGLCGFDTPPAGNPISFTVTLGAPVSIQDFSGSVRWYEFNDNGSSVNFGYRSEFDFRHFFVSIANDIPGQSEPDQIGIFTQFSQAFPIQKASFQILLQGNSTLLSGFDLPTAIDLLQTDIHRGSLTYSANGVSSQYSEFEIRSIEPLPVPIPAPLWLLSAGLMAWLGRFSRAHV